VVYSKTPKTLVFPGNHKISPFRNLVPDAVAGHRGAGANLDSASGHSRVAWLPCNPSASPRLGVCFALLSLVSVPMPN